MTAVNLTKRRILMMLIGVPLVGVSVAFFNVAEFGVDPFTVLVQGSFRQMPSSISYGLTYIILSVIELIAIILLDRKKIGVGTLINLFLLGYITDYTSRFLRFALGDMIGTMPIRILFMIIGVTLLSFSSGIYFTANMGVSTHDAVSLIALADSDEEAPGKSAALTVTYKYSDGGSDTVKFYSSSGNRYVAEVNGGVVGHATKADVTRAISAAEEL